MLPNTRKISPNTPGDNFEINFSEKDEKNKSALMDILQVFGMLAHVDCQSVFSNVAF